MKHTPLQHQNTSSELEEMEVAGQDEGEYSTGIQWYRADIQLDGTQNEFDILAVSVVRLVSAYEFYWDGYLIGTGGTVADSFEGEVSAPIKKILKLKQVVV